MQGSKEASKTRKKTFSMSDETEDKAKELSLKAMGRQNVSGYLTHLINKAYLEKN